MNPGPCERCGGSGEVDSGAPGPHDDFLKVPCECTERPPKCLFPDCTNREGEGRFEGPLCVPCAMGLRTNGGHGTDGASRLIKAAARGFKLEEKILALGDALRATRTLVDVRRRHGMSRASGVSWVAKGENDGKRFTVAEVEEIIEVATECVDAHEDHLRCLRELEARATVEKGEDEDDG